MAIERKATQENRFVRVILPWILAAAIFVVYCATVDRWVSFANLEQVANTAGLNWLPQFYGPVSFLLTLPIRLLPARLIPLGLNLFTVVCAALSMGLLARSVVLLPHDRTQEQREKQRGGSWLATVRAAWFPPVVAVLVCALELTFWEYGTSARSLTFSRFGAGGIEMLDLLLFAYIIRCLLEFRVAPEKESWLYKAAFVYGAAIANNWPMFSFSPPFFSFFPLFVVALIWIRGLAFFNVRFLIRMLVWGMVGTSLYLLLPIIQSITDPASPGVWAALKVQLSTQRGMQSLVLNMNQIFRGEHPLWVLTLYSLMPMLAIGIRWPSYFGDTSRLGQNIATFTFHLFHGAVLFLCLWVALGAPISPRVYFPWLPQLTLYYLSALGVGYLVSYFLIVFGSSASSSSSSRKPAPLTVFINRGVTGGVWVVCILTLVVLIYKNLPQIHGINGPIFKNFAALTVANLPKTNTVVIGDDRVRLLLLEAYATQDSRKTNLLFLDTSSFQIPEYHRFLHKKYGARWPTDPGKDVVSANPLQQMEALFYLNKSNALYYIHPSFGVYFELFDMEAHGMVYELVEPSTNSLRRPRASAHVIKENEAFWAKADVEALNGLIAASEAVDQNHPKSLPEKIFKALHISREPNPSAAALARYCSRSRNYWGVRMQAADGLTEAEKHFQRAFELNPDNIVATVNLKCNRALQKGQHAEVRDPQAVLDEFGRFRRWDEVMNENGPYDEPTFCFGWGLQLADEKNQFYRQAIEQFERVTALAPAHLMSRLWLGHMFLFKKRPDETLRVVEEIHARPDLFPPGRANLGEIIHLEASALLEETNLPAAQKVLNQALEKYPDDEELMATAARVYMDHAYYTNALPLLERQLARHPDDIGLLIHKGVANLQAGRFEDAIPVLNRVLTLETNLSEIHNRALLNRAITYLRAGKLDEAQQDYETLQRNFPTAFRIYYGLGEIAYQRKDTNAAIRNYQLYLTNSPISADEINSVRAKLKELRPGYPTP